MDLEYKIFTSNSSIDAESYLNEYSKEGFVLEKIYVQGQNIRFVMTKGFQSSPEIVRYEIRRYAEEQIRKHEMENQQVLGYNIGYVQAMNDLINSLKS